MAQKPRVKAPKQRATPKTADSSQTRRLLLFGGGGTLAAIAAVVVAFVLVGVGGSEPSPAEVRADLEAAGCTMRVVEAVPNISNHSDFPDPEATSPDWNTDPPTTGPHFGQTLIWGSYTDPIDIGRVLHNLEHGGVYIVYGDKVPDSTIAELQSFYSGHERGTILAPYAKLGNQIALGAWVVPGLPEASNDRGSGVIAKCKRFDEKAFSSFFDAFQFEGPESPLFSPSQMEPGRN